MVYRVSMWALQEKEMRKDMQNILVVEDDHDLNQAICYSLKKSGYESGAEEVILKTVFGF